MKQLRKIHEDYTEEVRSYYEESRGLRIGVIIDPAKFGINIGSLTSMLLPNQAPANVNNEIISIPPATRTASKQGYS